VYEIPAWKFGPRLAPGLVDVLGRQIDAQVSPRAGQALVWCASAHASLKELDEVQHLALPIRRQRLGFGHKDFHGRHIPNDTRALRKRPTRRKALAAILG